MAKKLVFMVLLLLFTGLLHTGAWAQDGDKASMGTSISSADEPASPYNSYKFKKAADFTDLTTFVLSTYSIDADAPRRLLPETLQDTEIAFGRDKGRPALFFVTYELDRFLLNTLVDSGRVLNLYTLEAQEYEGVAAVEDSEGTRSLASASGCDACNCVTWVRCARAPWLPYGLFTLEDKKRRINSSSAGSGKVAVHNIYYPYGHVSYVYKVSGSKIYIEEGNYNKCRVGTRSGSKSSLKIIGYIKK